MERNDAKDRRLAALAAAQHGVVSRAQLLVLGFTNTEVDRRVRAGRLHRLHTGVYAVGHPVLTVEGRWMAAVLAGGSNAVLSHATAAAAWDLLPAGSGAIHVTIPGMTGRARRTALKVHRSTTLTPAQTTSHRGIPITTAARTITDLSTKLKGRALERAVDRGERLGLVDFDELRRSAPPSLRAVLSRYNAAPTRSELEERFLELCDEHGIPRPQTNTRVNGLEVDFVWRDRRLIVEVDGYSYHRSPTAFETDRERDVTLTIAGWRVMRFTWMQITRRRSWVAVAIARGRD